MALTDTTIDAGEGPADAASAEDSTPPGGSAAAPQPWPPDTDHKVIGTLFVVVGILFLGATGVLALVMRGQLTGPRSTVVSATTYRQLFTLHGLLGVFGFLAPVWVGLATALVPLQIGSARLAFPRLQALALWLVVVGAGLMVGSPFAKGGKVVSGWSLSDPIPVGRAFRGHGPDLVILGLATVAVALLLASVNLVVTVTKWRAPGLTLRRTPLFTWSALVSSSVLLLALPVLVGALAMLFVDHHYGGRAFSGFTGSGGGFAYVWPRLFWFAAYPILWALLLPALGAVSEIVPVFARRRLFSHERAMGALGAVGALAFVGWGSEVSGLSRARWLFAGGALLVLLPVASLMLNWLATLGGAMRRKRRREAPRMRATPMAFALAFMPVLALGLAGAAVAAIGSTTTAHVNYWQVATQHTLFFGTSIVAAAAAVAYWAPKLWGRQLSAKGGPLAAGLIVVGLLATVVPMYILGIKDMRIHRAVYRAHGLRAANVVATVGAFVTALGALVLALDLLVSVVARRGRRATADPWDAYTLEWATSSPPPSYNFDRLPEVRSDTPLLDLNSAADAAALPEGGG